MLTERQKKIIAEDARYRGEFPAMVCARGIVGFVTGSKRHKDGRRILTGFQKNDPNKPWQSVCPKHVS